MPSSPGSRQVGTRADIVGVILAGGAGRRMGGPDKPLRMLAGRPLIEHVVRRLRPQVADILIAGSDPSGGFERLGLPVRPDSVAGTAAELGRAGPLAGILTGLEWAHDLAARRVLMVPGDTPFLPPDLVARLDAAGAPVACAASGGRRHGAVALFDPALAPTLRRALEQGARRLTAWLDEVGVVEVAWPDVSPPDVSPDAPSGAPIDPFFNINTPDDLARAAAMCERDAG